nr:MAG TPA: Dissimilatory copper-containing nitrite reductase [Caudoviricetes sp.]
MQSAQIHCKKCHRKKLRKGLDIYGLPVYNKAIQQNKKQTPTRGRRK